MKDDRPLEIPNEDVNDYKAVQKLIADGKPEKGVKLLGAIADRNADNGVLQAVYASALDDLGYRERALTYFKKAIALCPDWEPGSLGLFHCLLDLGREREAHAEMQRFLALADSDEYREIIVELGAAPG